MKPMKTQENFRKEMRSIHKEYDQNSGRSFGALFYFLALIGVSAVLYMCLDNVDFPKLGIPESHTEANSPNYLTQSFPKANHRHTGLSQADVDDLNHLESCKDELNHLEHDKFIVLAGDICVENVIPYLRNYWRPLKHHRLAEWIPRLRNLIEIEKDSDKAKVLHMLFNDAVRLDWTMIGKVPFKNGICR